MARYHVPGVAIGILHDGDEDIAAYGVTNLEHPLPVDGDTLFQIASITKTMTATVVMRLVERGALDLDAPVRRYLPEFRLRDDDAAKRATLRHLVTHTTGWLGDCFADFGKGDDALARYVAAMADLEQLTPLGEIWHYSNSSFAVLGRLIEVATGKTYEAAVRELLFIPLGMAKSCFNADEAITHRVAAGHVIVDEQPRVARPWAFPRATTPVGGVVSCIRDLLAYASFHLGDGRAPDGARLLSVGSLELRRTQLTPAASASPGSCGTSTAFASNTTEARLSGSRASSYSRPTAASRSPCRRTPVVAGCSTRRSRSGRSRPTSERPRRSPPTSRSRPRGAVSSWPATPRPSPMSRSPRALTASLSTGRSATTSSG